MVAVRVYVEGGGSTRREQKALQIGFGQLFGKIATKGSLPAVIACGGRASALREFGMGLRSHPDALCVLLVDSGSP
jgi:hypothetical protein